MTLLVNRMGTLDDTSCRECRAINTEKVFGKTKMKWYISPPPQYYDATHADMAGSLSCGVVSSVTKSILELRRLPAPNAMEADTKLPFTLRIGKVVEEQSLRVQYEYYAIYYYDSNVSFEMKKYDLVKDNNIFFVEGREALRIGVRKHQMMLYHEKRETPGKSSPPMEFHRAATNAPTNVAVRSGERTARLHGD